MTPLVDVIFAQPWISHERGEGPGGQKRYSIWDVYPHADLITYPSTYEGFGNAFLEAICFRKPIFCDRYAIYRTEIEPCGVRAITMDGYLTDEVVEQVRRVLTDEDFREQLVETNYQVGCRFFSFEHVESELRSILNQPQVCQRFVR